MSSWCIPTWENLTTRLIQDMLRSVVPRHNETLKPLTSRMTFLYNNLNISSDFIGRKPLSIKRTDVRNNVTQACLGFLTSGNIYLINFYSIKQTGHIFPFSVYYKYTVWRHKAVRTKKWPRAAGVRCYFLVN